MPKSTRRAEQDADHPVSDPIARAAWQFQAIGTIRTCFTEKFGIPRQPGLVPEAEGILTLLPPFDQAEMVRELEGFSHVWVLFVFHGLAGRGFKSTVRPPRLGGQRRIGVLASRSGFRPNPIGMSVVELAAVEFPRGRTQLRLRGVDLLDGTPVLDIKPYLPYADCVPGARGGFAAAGSPELLGVTFSARAREQLTRQTHLEPAKFQRLIAQVLSQDPRPAYAGSTDAERVFGMTLWDYNVRWQVTGGRVRVLSVMPYEE